jgi:hypothetical protein
LASHQTKSTRFYSILLILFIFLPNFFTLYQIPFYGGNFEDDLITEMVQPTINDNIYHPLLESQSRSGFDDEVEPNNDISSSIQNGNELHDTNTMRGEMRYNTDEVDYFYIPLTGGGQATIDRLNITPEFSDPVHIDNKSVGIKLKMYTGFESELFLLEYKILGTDEAIKTDLSEPWTNATSLFINADRTSRYFLEVTAVYIRNSVTHEVINPEAMINYSLHVSVTSFTGSDRNNDINNGTALTGPIGGLSLSQGNDHWDWYTINSMTSNRAINLSLSIKINTANKSGYISGIQHYVKVSTILKCFDLEKNQEIKITAFGDKIGLYGPNPILMYLNATFDQAYLGIHSLQRKFKESTEVDVVGSGETSTVKYSFQAITLKLVNSIPKLLQPKVAPTSGNLQDNYKFTVIYQDEDNDEPWYVNLVIGEDENNMTLSSDAVNDGDFTNGELYERILPGSDFENIPHDKYKTISYGFNAYDYYSELSLPMLFVESATSTDLKVIDNVKPTLRPNLPEAWVLQEDQEPLSIKLLKVLFKDPDSSKYSSEVKFQVWSKAYDWDKIMDTKNLTAEVLADDTLNIEPKLNQYGTDTIPIRAYDVEGPGTAVYLNLKTIINPINDKPILAKPPDYIDEDSKTEDEYCNITFVADDSADKNLDLLIYSVDIFDKIPLLKEDPKKYKFHFSNYTGKLTFIPDNDIVGTYILNISVMDNGTVEPVGLMDLKQFVLNIENVNDPPSAVITHPEEGAKFNTSAEIELNGKNSTDDDIPHGDFLNYAWYVYYNGTDEEFLGASTRPTTTAQIKEAGYHVLKLRVKDKAGEVSETTINLRIIPLVGDIPGGDDSDEDGIPDLWELRYDLDPDKFDSDLDPDNDSYSNLKEYLGEDNMPGGDDSSNPQNPSSVPGDLDADSLPDFWEREMFNSLLQTPTGDYDDDGFTNLQEYLGIDGLPGNDDWSDPLDWDSIPVGKKDDSKDGGIDLGTILIIASVVVAIIIVLLISQIYLTKQRKKAKEAEEKEKEKASGEKKAIYTPEPQPVPMMPPTTTGPAMQPPLVPAQAPSGPMPMAMPMPMRPMPMQFPQMQYPASQPQAPMQPMTPTPQVQQPKATLGLPAAGKVLETDDSEEEVY